MRAGRTLLLVGLGLLVLSDVATAGRRGKGGKKKGRSSGRDEVEEVVVSAAGQVGDDGDDEFGGFASAPKKQGGAPAASGGGRDMSSEFAKYATCQDCTGAGWGWCPIRRMCGGFANKDCRGDETDVRVGAAARAAAAAAPSSDERPADWRNTEDTTRLWEVISSGDVDELETMLSANSELARVRSEDGRGPLFWAHEYKQPEMVQLLLKHGADAKARDGDGKSPSGIAASQKRERRKQAPPAGGDMSAYFATLKTCSDCLEAGYGWCPIRRRCGGFANKNCRGDGTDYQEGAEPAGSSDDAMDGFAAAPKASKGGAAAAAAGGGRDMSSVFNKIKSCSDCIGQGYGWCPIRRRCGGFANKNCRGDETDIKED